jgi:agmatine/peptidylarginine deiminase
MILKYIKKLDLISDFDFSDIEVRGEFEELEYIYIPFAEENMLGDIPPITEFIKELIKICSKFSKVRVVISKKKKSKKLFLY